MDIEAAGSDSVPSMADQLPPQQPPAYPPKEVFASFADRLVATLWDNFVYMLPAWVAEIVGSVLLLVGIVMADSGESEGMGVTLIVIGIGLLALGVVLMVILLIRNYILRQGRTGYTWGKARVGIRVVNELDGQPAGVGKAVGRYFLHALINQACYLDYLWALWDPRRQTITDKLLNTVVVRQPVR